MATANVHELDTVPLHEAITEARRRLSVIGELGYKTESPEAAARRTRRARK
jgi:hypothetical protein